MNDALGDRIKRYEAAANYKLTPKSSLIIRVDGKAFHTWTKPFDRPFDHRIIEAMIAAAERTASEMTGFKLAYIQSDEATFLLRDTDSYGTQGWFDYELNKLVSVSASMFTAYFNDKLEHPLGKPAMFDSRAFIVPEEDAPNVFVWRQQDWARNSLMMYAREYFSHRALLGKSTADVHEMLHEQGLNWAELSDVLKNGTFIYRKGALELSHDVRDYNGIKRYLDGGN